MILMTLDLMSGMRRTPLSVERAATWISPVNEAMRDWGVDTPLRAAAMLAQVAHECTEFTELRENLNYSADALVRTWPTRFWLPEPVSPLSVEQQALQHPGKANALDYHRQPQRIANRVYANRLGNGDEASGDGWAYRAGGAIGITGKDGYRAASIAVCGDADTLVVNPELIISPRYAMQTAGYYWQSRGLNRFADARDIDGCTTRINGGMLGARQRRENYDLYMARFKQYLGAT